jgi:hypothetical protein
VARAGLPAARVRPVADRVVRAAHLQAADRPLAARVVPQAARVAAQAVQQEADRQQAAAPQGRSPMHGSRRRRLRDGLQCMDGSEEIKQDQIYH